MPPLLTRTPRHRCAGGAPADAVRRTAARIDRPELSPAVPPGAGGAPGADGARLAWQADAAVRLLERFGDLLAVALEAVGEGDDAVFAEALAERDRLVVQLEPLLGTLAAARVQAHEWPALEPDDADWDDDLGDGGALAPVTLARILAPVDEALRHAQHLHRRLSDEVRGHAVRSSPPRPAGGHAAPVVLLR